MWVRVRERRDLLQGLITMQVNGHRALTEAIKMRRDRPGGV